MTLSDFSNPELVDENVYHLFGPNMILLPSTRQDKKYMIYDWLTHKMIHFGSANHLDYTKYLQITSLEEANEHRRRYLKRAMNIKGNWKKNPFSPNNLSMSLLWQDLS